MPPSLDERRARGRCIVLGYQIAAKLAAKRMAGELAHVEQTIAADAAVLRREIPELRRELAAARREIERLAAARRADSVQPPARHLLH